MSQDLLAKEPPESSSNSTPLSVGDMQAAQLLGISRAGLHRFVRRGLVPRPFKLGRRTLYRVADLQACIDRLAAL